MPTQGKVLRQGIIGTPPAVIANMVAYWKCDEGTGTTAEDSTANNRDATLQGNPTWVAGRCGYGGDYAVDLDGTGDYLSVADDAAFSFGNGATDSAFSIKAHFKLNSLSTATAIFSKYDVNGTAREYGVFFDTDGRIRFRIYDESSDGYLERRTDEVLDLNKWYMITCTYTGTAVATNLKIYLNTVQVDLATSSSGVYTAMEDTATAPMIGAFTDTGGTIKTIDGIVDNISVHNVALTAAEIRTYYNDSYPYDGKIRVENTWQLISDETIEKAITSYHYPVPLFGDLDGGYITEHIMVNGNASTQGALMRINGVTEVANYSVLYNTASTASGAYAATNSATDGIVEGSGAANNFTFVVREIPFSAQGERFTKSTVYKVSGSAGPVHYWQDHRRLTTPGTTTEITSLGSLAGLAGGFGVGSRFRLYKLKNFS